MFIRRKPMSGQSIMASASIKQKAKGYYLLVLLLESALLGVFMAQDWSLRLPLIDIHTVGAGGGSIGWLDPGGALRVGPRSAGAVPGPAAYGQGGTEPTVTDANLVAGHLPGDLALGGRVPLQPDRATDAVGRLARAMGIDVEAAAAAAVGVSENIPPPYR